VTKVYRAAPGFHLTDEQAQVYGDHLAGLAERTGPLLTPDDVVKDARPSASPTHEWFIRARGHEDPDHQCRAGRGQELAGAVQAVQRARGHCRGDRRGRREGVAEARPGRAWLSAAGQGIAGQS
jgi:hypothetical protein